MQEVVTEKSAESSPALSRAAPILCLLAIGFSIAGWTRLGSDAFVIDRRAFWAEAWRLFTAPLVHEHVVQLLVGLTGVWFFGRAVERLLGTGRMLGLCALLALGVGFAEQALDHGGTGLTGIAFGLWALLVAGGWRARALRGVVPVGLSVLMVAAFLLCIVALPVSNWGQGAGALLGALAGVCLDERGRLRQAFLPLALVLLGLLAAGATYWRTSWNFGGASVEYDRAGFDALERGDEPEAERLFRVALAFDERDGHAWWNLCCVLDRLGRKEEAAEAGWNAYENTGFDERQLAYLEDILRKLCDEHVAADEPELAFPCATRLARLAPEDLRVWQALRALADELGEDDWYDLADRECKRLDPQEK